MIWIRGTEPRRRRGERGLVVSSQWVSDWGHVARGTMPSIGTRPRRHLRSGRVVIRDGRRNLARQEITYCAHGTCIYTPEWMILPTLTINESNGQKSITTPSPSQILKWLSKKICYQIRSTKRIFDRPAVACGNLC